MTRLGNVSSWIHRHQVVVALTAATGVALAGYLFFGVFGVHLLFVDDVVQEADPFAAGPGASGMDGDALSPEKVAAMNQAMVDDQVPSEAPAADPMPSQLADGPQVLSAGAFMDRSHPTSGQAEILTDGASRVLRLEDLQTDNGPDLNVYLVAAPSDAAPGELVADAVDLGDLKGNIGDQNYVIPDDVDLDRYTTVVIWCVRFGVAFGTAGLT